MNISQIEYTTKYNEYLSRIRDRQRRELLIEKNHLEYLNGFDSSPSSSSSSSNSLSHNNYDDNIYFYSTILTSYVHNASSTYHYRKKRSLENLDNYVDNNNVKMFDSNRTNTNSSSSSIFIRFPLKIHKNEIIMDDIDANNNTNDHQNDIDIANYIEDANLRLMLITLPPASSIDNDLMHQKYAATSNLQQSTTTRDQQQDHHGRRNRSRRPRPRPFHNHQNNRTFSEKVNKLENLSDSYEQQFNNNQKNIINIKVYQLIDRNHKIWLDSKQIEINNHKNIQSQTHRWFDLDVTKAITSWLNGNQENLGFEIQCDKCKLYNSYISNDLLSPTTKNKFLNNDANSQILNLLPNDNNHSPILNIIRKKINNNHNKIKYKNSGNKRNRREKRSRQHHHLMPPTARRKRKTDCYEGNQKCCRHSMEVIFREIKGFEFIIQPKIFDAGYCRGKCPPRYNPAHHHAVLQSLIWKQDHSKAPRPCCAPSKLVELEILHVDEKDSRKLKVSTWNDMKVVECACS